MTLFSNFLHMHENGRRIQTRQYRNDSSGNEVLVHTAEVEYFSFEQAGGHTTYTDGTVMIQVGEKNEPYVKQTWVTFSSYCLDKSLWPSV